MKSKKKSRLPRQACSRSSLFRKLQKEYGQCLSKLVFEWADGTKEHLGWIFQGRHGIVIVSRSSEVFVIMPRENIKGGRDEGTGLHAGQHGRASE